MGQAPDDDTIANFTAFTGVDRHTAIDFLTAQKQPLDIQLAVQQWFDAQDGGTSNFLPTEVWSENDMHAGKEYGPQTNPQNSYKIHSGNVQTFVQTLGPDIFKNSLSRPPSRVDVRVDDKEDAELQRGLLNSMSQSQYENTKTSFGPAGRDHYPASQWSMVTTSHNILPDPEPKQRVRMIGSPSFIKPTQEENRLPSLLTIYQQIPLACEALLAHDHVRAEYGTSKDWWQGDSIPDHGVVLLDDTLAADAQTPVIDETQRLMAFLELTERAYGSCDSLMESLGRSRHRPWTDEIDTDAYLLATWLGECMACGTNENLRDTFTTAAFDKLDGNVISNQTFQVFVLSLRYDLDGTPSLYDLIDEVLWGSWVVEHPSEVTIKPAPVMTFQFRSSGKPAEWPLVWYADRYLEENKDKALHMLHEQNRTEEERNTLQMQQNKLEQVTSSKTKKSIAATDLLKVVKPFLNGERPPVDELERRDEVISTGAKYHPLDQYQKIGRELQAVADEILQKHEALEQAKSQLTSHKRTVTDFLKGNSNSPEDKPIHRYTLRGISTDQYTTYILANPNASEDLLQTDVNSWDWWRIHWDTKNENPIDLRKVDEAEVLEAARKSNVAAAVYASDEAVNHHRQPIPDSLKNFVRADNLHFSSEIEFPEFSSKRKAEDRDWRYSQGRGYNYASRSRNSSPDSMVANMDTDMNDQWDSNNDENYPPSYTSTPPPIPPRTGEKRRAPPRPSVKGEEDDLMEMDDPQQSGSINLIDDNTHYDQEMVEINSPASLPAPVSEVLNNEAYDSVPTDQLPSTDKKQAQTLPSTS